VVDDLCSEFELNSNSIVADVGAGTGIFTGQLLKAELSVVAVEPNERMRNEADKWLGKYDNYSSISGTAERTGLADASVDVVTVAQAYHWFRPEQPRAEFLRILKRPPGVVALIWNRRDDNSDFLQEYESLLTENLPEYNRVKHTRLSDDDIQASLGCAIAKNNYVCAQSFDFDGLKGRLLSSSYAPSPGQPGYGSLMVKLRSLYDRYAVNDRILFSYRTQVYAAVF
jgi:SAM-dependent methyltransferase